MFNSVKILGYRGFKSLAVDRLRRVNLIAGPNNSGKTSLLEAIFLLAHGGNPQPAIRKNVVLGGIGRGVGLDTDATALWAPLFSDLNLSRQVSITGMHQHFGSLDLKIEHRYSATMRTAAANLVAHPRIDGAPELHFTLTQRFGRQGSRKSVKSLISFGKRGA